MTFSKNNNYKSEKNFGQIFSLVFLIIAIYPLYNDTNLKIFPFIISLIILVLAYLQPKILKIPNKLWIKFGVILSKLITPLIISLMYLLTIVPFGIFFKFTNRDPLRLKKKYLTPLIGLKELIM